MAFLSLLFFAVLSQSPQLQAEAIRATKQKIVRTIDPTLPAMTLERWLQQQLGPQVEMAWEVNDCGEASGSAADAARDLPFCVGASAELPDGRNLTLFFFSGTAKTGLSSAPLELYFGAISPFRGDGETFDALRDLPKRLMAQ